jgi:hypothetical protein
MRFKASSSLQVTVKPSPAASKSARGYRDFKILRVILADYLILARIISQDLGDRLSSIRGGAHFRGGLAFVEEGHCIAHCHLQGIEFGIRLYELERGQAKNMVQE